MRAHIGTEITLDTTVRIPARNVDSYPSLFVGGGTKRYGAVHVIDKGRYGKLVAPLGIDFALDEVDIFHQRLIVPAHFIGQIVILCRFPGGRNIHFHELLRPSLDRLMVHLDNIISLFGVCLCRCVLHIPDCLVFRNNSRDDEKCRLQNSVNPAAETDLLAEGKTVNRVEMNVIFRNIALDLSRQVFLELVHAPRAIQQKGAARF